MEQILLEQLIVVQLIMEVPKLVNSVPCLHNFITYLLNTHFNIILQSVLRSPKWSLPSEFHSAALILAIMRDFMLAS